MESAGDGGAAAPSVFDQLREVARAVDRDMTLVQRARHDPLAFMDHDPAETLLGLRADIESLRHGITDALEAETTHASALQDMVAAAAGFVEQRRTHLDKTEAYLAQYGYHPQPPQVVVTAAADDAGEDVGGEQVGSAARPTQQPASDPTNADTPEDVVLSDVTMHMLRDTGRGNPLPASVVRAPLSASRGVRSTRGGTPRLLQPGFSRTMVASAGKRTPLLPLNDDDGDDTNDVAAVLNCREISLPEDCRPSPLGVRRPVLAGDRVEITPQVWVRRRSTLLRPQPMKTTPSGRKENQVPASATLRTPRVATVAEEDSRWAAALADTPPSPVLSSVTQQLLQQRQAAAESQLPAEPTVHGKLSESPKMSDVTRAIVGLKF